MSALIDFSILSSIAAIEIGILVSSVLFGIVTLQAFIYFRTYPSDPKPLKILVCCLIACSLFNGLHLPFAGRRDMVATPLFASNTCSP